MQTKLIITAILTSVFCTGAFAQTTFGVPSCKQWREATGAQATTFKSWYLGYVSGLSVMEAVLSKGSQDTLKKVTSANETLSWADRFCAAHLSEDLADAGMGLMSELRTKK